MVGGFQIEAKEVVLHDIEVSNALVDYISNHSVSNIVVGASNRNALTRSLSISLSLLSSFIYIYILALCSYIVVGASNPNPNIVIEIED